MPAKVSVWVDKFVDGWSGAEGEQPVPHPVVSVVDAVKARYGTDAHFAPYRLVGENGAEYPDCPRLKNETLAHLADYGVRAVQDVVVADIDHPETHKGQTEEPPAQWRTEMWDKAVAVCGPTLMYETRGGLRVIAALPQTLDVKQAQAWGKRFRKWLRDWGLPADEISAWSQCYRLHDVMRDGKRQGGRCVTVEPLVPDLTKQPPQIAPEPEQPAQPEVAAGIDLRQPFKLPRRIEEGSRHHTLVRYAAQLRWQGLDEQAIADQLAQVNAQRCRPPAPADEIAEIAKWAGEQEDERTMRAREAREAHAQRVAAAQAAGQPAPEEPEDDPFELGDHTEIANRVIARLSKGSPVPMVVALGEVWRYDPQSGYWKATPQHIIERVIHSYSGAPVRTEQPNGGWVWRPMKVNDNTVIGVVRSIHRLLSDPDFFKDAPAGVALADCWVRVGKNGVERLPHEPWQRATTGYDFNWTDEDPDIFGTMLRDYWGHRECFGDNVKVIMEFIGACLCGIASRYQVCIILKGRGSNGKSQILLVLVGNEHVQGVFPQDTVTSVSPQQFGSESYKAMLSNSRINVVGELPERKISQEAAASLKALISGDEVVARHLYKNPFRFKPRAGHIVSANNLPDVEDDSDGLFRRFVILDFDRQFDPTGPDSRSIGEQVLEEDRARIVCAALRATPDLINRGKFLTPKESVDEITAWRTGQDEISLFLKDCTDPCEPVRGNGSDGDSLYTVYAVWSKQNGYDQMNKNKFLSAIDKRRKRFYDNGLARRMYPVTLRKI